MDVPSVRHGPGHLAGADPPPPDLHERMVGESWLDEGCFIESLHCSLLSMTMQALRARPVPEPQSDKK